LPAALVEAVLSLRDPRLVGRGGTSLWDEEDGFFYDFLHLPGGSRHALRVRSMVGIVPLFAVETLDSGLLERLPAFKRRLDWFVENRPDLTEHVASMRRGGANERRLLAVVRPDRLHRVLQVLLNENEFLSTYRVAYEPAESATEIFGGNSNWRGPIWFPLNYLLIEALQKFHHYFGDEFTVEFPTGSGTRLTLAGSVRRAVASPVQHLST